MLHKVILFIRTHEDVSDDLVRRCRNFKEALKLCIPLRWLALKRGYGLHRLKSALEVENEKLKAELEEERKKREIILETFREIRGAV